MEQKIVYYQDELNDEFSGFSRDTITIDEKYRYQHHFLWNMAAFVVYRLIMTPVAYFYMKFKYKFRVVNRKCLKECKKQGYFLYGNHTLVPADGYIPNVMAFPKRVKVVVHPDNLSLKGTKTFMEMIGAFPIPNKMSGMRNFTKTMHLYLEQKKVITIYPEAHIWPFYTKIRPFKSTSFAYPVKEDKPSYCFTVTYQKNKKKPKITAYMDGPFYPNRSLNVKDAQQDLRDRIYNVMVERSKNSSYQHIQYIKKEEDTSC